MALAAAGVAAIGLGVASVKAAADFQSQMTLIKTQAHDATDNIQQLGQSVLGLASTVGIGPTQLAEGLYHVTSVGYRGAEAMQILKVAAEGSKVGMASLDDTAYALTSTMTTFGLKGDQAASTMATLSAIVGAGDMKFASLNAAISTGFFAAGETFGVSIQSMGAALAYLTDRGASADEAATRLKMSITLLGAPTKQSAAILKDLGMTQADIATRTSAMDEALAKSGVTVTQLSADLRKPDGIQVALQDLVTHMKKAGLSADETAAVLARAFGGGRSGAAIMSMTQHLDTLQSKFVLINQGQASFGADFAATMDTLNARESQVQAGMQAWEIEMGQRLMPMAILLLGWLASQLPTLEQWAGVFLDQMIPAVQQFAGSVGRLLPVLAPIVGAFLGLLPVSIKVLATLIDLVTPIASLVERFPLLVPILAGLVAMWIAMNIQMAITRVLASEVVAQFLVAASAEGVLTASQWLLNIAMDANPIGVVIGLIGLLVTAVVLVATHTKQTTDALGWLWDRIRQGAAILGPFIEQHKALAVAIGLIGGPAVVLIGVGALLITHWKQLGDALAPFIVMLRVFWAELGAGLDPLEALAGVLGRVAYQFGLPAQQINALETAVGTLGGLRKAPSEADFVNALDARSRLPADTRIATAADQRVAVDKTSHATAPLLAVDEQKSKAAHANLARDQEAIAKAQTPAEKVGDFFSALGTKARQAADFMGSGIRAIGAAFDWLGTHSGEILHTIGGYFSWLGTRAHDIADGIGGFFSAVGSIAHAVAKAVGDVFSVIGTVMNVIRIVFVTAFAIWLGLWIAIAKVLFTPLVNAIKTVAPIVGGAMSAIGTAVHDGWNAVSGFVGGAMSAIGTAVRNGWDAASKWVGNAMSDIGAGVHGAWNAIYDFVGGVMSAIGTTVRNAWNAISAFVGGLMSAIGTTVRNAWTGIADFFGPVLNRIWTTIDGVWNRVWSSVTGWAGRTRDAVLQVWDDIALAAEGLGGKLMGGIKGGLNDVIGALNSFIDNANGFLGHFGVPKVDHIPMIKMAEGGVVSRPTVALIGEGGGPEVVIPTEPGQRGRGKALWEQAGAMLGMLPGCGQMGGAALGSIGGQCVGFVEDQLGIFFAGNANQWVDAPWPKTQIAMPGEVAVFTGGEFGHVAIVTSAGDGYSFGVIDSNWVAPLTVGAHTMNRGMYGFNTFLLPGKPLPPGLAGQDYPMDALNGIAKGALGGFVDKAVGGLGGWVGGVARGMLEEAVHGSLHFDSGGILPPGISSVFNGTGRGESVLGSRAEEHLSAIRDALQGGRSMELHTHVQLGDEAMATIVTRIADAGLSRLLAST